VRSLKQPNVSALSGEAVRHHIIMVIKKYHFFCGICDDMTQKEKAGK